MDYPRAVAKVDELIGLLEASQQIYSRNTDRYYAQPAWMESERQIRRALPAVLAIAEKTYDRVLNRLVETEGWGWPWQTCYEATQELAGALASAAETADILGPEGPKLSAENLHPWVWHAAVDLWDSQHFRQAVLDAYTKVERLTQAKTGRQDVSGKQLWGEVFSLNAGSSSRPKLRFVGVDPASERFRSAQEGALHFGQGCAQGIRNWAAHTEDDAEEQDALEYLAALSVLARWVDDCKVESDT